MPDITMCRDKKCPISGEVYDSGGKVLSIEPTPTEKTEGVADRREGK